MKTKSQKDFVTVSTCYLLKAYWGFPANQFVGDTILLICRQGNWRKEQSICKPDHF